MSEERTPIEELKYSILKGKAILDGYSDDLGFKRGYQSCTDVILIKIEELTEADKAYREKYKHTKEDVIEGYQNGRDKSCFYGANEKPYDRAKEYYNETHNK